MLVLFGTKCIWKKKKYLAKQKLSATLALRLRLLIMILKCTCSNVPKNLLIICPHPPHTPPLTTEPYCSRVSRLLHTCRIRVTSLSLMFCIPYNHFIGVTRVFSIEWKSHKPILYLTSVATDHSRITVGFSFGAEIEIVSSIQSYSEFL